MAADQLDTIVQRMIDAGEPEANIATVIQHFKSQQPPADKGVMAGIVDTLPTPSGIVESIKAIPQALKERTDGTRDLITGQLNDPAAAKAEQANTPVGKLVNGRPREAIGNFAGIAGQAGLAEALPPMTGRLMKGGEKTIQGVSVKDLRAAGVGEPAINATVNGRTVLRGKLQTAGSGTAAPTAAPEAAATPMSAPPAQPAAVPAVDKPMWFSSELGANRGGPWGHIETPTTGLEPGSPEAARMSAMHKYDAETVNRYNHMLQNQNGSVSPQMLKTLELPAEVMKYPIAHHYGGPLGVGAVAATDLARLAVSHPTGTAQAVRAAILARLAAADVTPVSSHGQ